MKFITKEIKQKILEYFDKLIKSDIRLPEIYYKNISNIKIENINLWYPLIPKFAYAHIFYDPLSEELVYYVEEPELSEDERLMLKKTKEEIIDKIYYSDIEKAKSKEEIILDYLIDIIRRTKINIDENSIIKIFYYLWRDMVGLEKIEPLMHDLLIEDISCDGYDIPIYVHHKKFGILRTNISFSKEELERFIIKLAQKCNRYVSYAEPLLDATLPDGSRVNATYSSDVTTRGPTFTIRKFREIPWSPIDLVRIGTVTPEMLAFLWLAIEHKRNILIIGGTSSGKTTLLNAISMFIPPNARIVSIEDTREIQLFHKNWVPAVVRYSYEKNREIDMFQLLRESFRQRPDYIIVGEVRGKEAYVMFQGMASGHAALSTMHATSVRALIERLTTPPINLPKVLLELLDIVIIMQHDLTMGRNIRRVKEIDEMKNYSEYEWIFKWNPYNSSYEMKKYSIVFEKISSEYGISIETLWREWDLRRRLLWRLTQLGITDYRIFSRVVGLYYINKEAVLQYYKIL